jgi:hypothetical protein
MKKSLVEIKERELKSFINSKEWKPLTVRYNSAFKTSDIKPPFYKLNIQW